MITVRPESAYNSFITQPFEMGIRHLRVAFCDESQETLTNMARERIIYRAPEVPHSSYSSPGSIVNGEHFTLTHKQRAFHLIVGLTETVGVLAAIGLGFFALAIPYIAAQIDMRYHKPVNCDCRYDDVRIHLEERGCNEQYPDRYRRNPFHENGSKDPFYRYANWAIAQHVIN